MNSAVSVLAVFFCVLNEDLKDPSYLFINYASIESVGVIE